MSRIQHIRRWLEHRNTLMKWNEREARLIAARHSARYAHQRDAIEQRIGIVHGHQRRLEQRMHELRKPIADIFERRINTHP